MFFPSLFYKTHGEKFPNQSGVVLCNCSILTSETAFSHVQLTSVLCTCCSSRSRAFAHAVFKLFLVNVCQGFFNDIILAS